MKRVEIRLDVDELLTDITEWCQVAAGGAEAAGATVSADVRDVGSDGNRRLMEKRIGRLMAEATQVLYPFAKVPVRCCRAEDDGCEVEGYVVTLDFPYERSGTDVVLLRHAVRDYVVYSCVAGWLAVALPGSAQAAFWTGESGLAREALTEALVLPLRVKRVRVKGYGC